MNIKFLFYNFWKIYWILINDDQFLKIMIQSFIVIFMVLTTFCSVLPFQITPCLESIVTYNYLSSRYCGGSTPCSSGSVSPGSAALSPPPPSPRSALSHPPLCTTPSATLQEFLNATTHFSNLTLNGESGVETVLFISIRMFFIWVRSIFVIYLDTDRLQKLP